MNSTGTGTIGRVGLWTESSSDTYFADTHVTIVRPDTRRIAPGFLAEALLSAPVQRAMETTCFTGSTNQLELNRAAFGELQLLLPPLGEQRRIAAILSSVDDAIEATQAVIEQLQVVKKAMMAELLTRGLPGRHTRFKQTELGEIPRDWEVIPLVECLREPIRNGYSAVCSTVPTGQWLLHLGAVTFDGFNPRAVKPAPRGDRRLEGARVEAGDLLVSRANTRERVGLAGVYRGFPDPCFYPDLMMRLRVGARVTTDFLELVLLSARARGYLSSAARGTSESMVKVNRDLVGSMLVQLPSVEEQQKIVESIQAVAARVASERASLESLGGLKAALMSVLLTGEVRVRPDEDAA